MDTSEAALQVTGRGVRSDSDWAAGWLNFYQDVVPGYNDAEWTITNVLDAYGSLPNILLGGTEKTQSRWESLGFSVQVSQAESIARAAQRYERESIPVADLAPMEYLGYFKEGWYTAKQDVKVTPHGSQEPITIAKGVVKSLL